MSCKTDPNYTPKVYNKMYQHILPNKPKEYEKWKITFYFIFYNVILLCLMSILFTTHLPIAMLLELLFCLQGVHRETLNWLQFLLIIFTILLPGGLKGGDTLHLAYHGRQGLEDHDAGNHPKCILDKNKSLKPNQTYRALNPTTQTTIWAEIIFLA